jgi:hypothetical protein
MTTTKKAQGGVRSKRGTLEAQAGAIVDDVTGFDGDTRLALSWALVRLKDARAGATAGGSVEKYERELRELLDKVARGAYVFDVNEVGAGHVYAAQTIYDLIDGTIPTPEFVHTNLQMTIHEAGRRTGVELWVSPNDDDNDRGDFSVQRIARMFKHHPSETFNMVPELDLAGLISAVLKHPDTPEDIYGGIRQGLARLTEAAEVNEHPDVIAVALAVHKPEGGEQ